MGFDRRNFMGWLASAGVALRSGAALARGGKSGHDQPNIIFIMADDLGYADLSCTGSRHIRTPNIDRIAREGAFLTQGYANSSICSPTRTGLLTGCYQQRFQIGLEEPLGSSAIKDIGVPLDRRTIASVLKEQGYSTALIGKWHLGEPPQHSPLRHGYDHFYGIIQGGADYFRHKMVFGGKESGSGLVSDNDPIERNGYMTDLFGDEAARLIRAKGDAPLFLSLHFTAPHWPWEGREDEEESRALKDMFHMNGGSLETYAKMVEAMDDNVGKLLAALDEMGIADNSIVVFTSDNGGERYSDTWPFVGVKGELLEGGIRVPILARWPKGIKPGTTSEQVMISMDFLPTLLAAAGGKGKPGEFDGMNLLPQLMGTAAPVERTLFWRFKASEQAAVRQGDWKYLRLGGKEHLFNVHDDPRERADKLLDMPDKVAALKALYDQWNAQMLPYWLESYSEPVKTRYPDRY